MVVGALLLPSVLAGCGGETRTALGSGGAPPAAPDADTGAVSGIVIDDERRPLSGVQVAVLTESIPPSKTDAVGAYSISNIPPGRYGVAASRLGYHSESQSVEVAAGHLTSLNLTLRPIAPVVSHVEHLIDDGYIDLAFTVPSVRLTPGAASKTTFKHNATEGAVSLVSTGTWDKSTPTTATWMGLNVVIGEQSNYTEGAHPSVTTRVLGIELNKRTSFSVTFTMPFVCTAGQAQQCTEHPPNRVAQVLYEQRTKVYTDVYYVDAAAPDAKAGPAV